MVEKIQLALAAEVMEQLVQLPHKVQPKVSRFIAQFQKNPTSPGHNYERVKNARNPQMHSVRIDQSYRGIVLKPERGNVYLLLWVGAHDDAYAWAEKHRCAVNPESGTLQVYSVDHVVENATPVAPEQSAFAHLRDRQLMRLGVPEELIPLVREVADETDLDAIQQRLPVEAYEDLFMILAGSHYEQILAGRESVARVDTSDVAAALERPTTQARFVVVEDETELTAMLNAPLEKWRVFLHPSQRCLVEGTKSGPVRVLGGAGTGKTVVAMHRARWLAKRSGDKRRKVLFTTFTRNLATDIWANLELLCKPAELERIEVLNLDSWVSRFLRSRRYEYQIAYEEHKLEACWRSALDLKPAQLDLADGFFREEWQRVIQLNSIETLDQYKRVSRVGRGTTLSRSQRIKLWPVFEEYRNQLNLQRLVEVDDAYRQATDLLVHSDTPPPYVGIIVDEAQDMSPQAFRLLRQLVAEGANDLFIVGDGHQRIYGRNRVVLGQCGINIRGRAHKLHINYRTTEEIRTRAVALLEGLDIDDLDGTQDDNHGYKSLTHGVPPQHQHFPDAGEQLRYLVEYLQQTHIDLTEICVVARIHRELDILAKGLESHDIATARLQGHNADTPIPGTLRLATMHRVKGLEFRAVILASINAGVVPLAQVVAGSSDVAEQRQADLEERALLYVALTRAREQALILSYGEASPYLMA